MIFAFFLNSATAEGGPDAMASGLDAEDYPITVNFTAAAKSSECLMFGPDSPMDQSYSADVYETFATQNVSHNSHHAGFYPNTLASDPFLASNMTLLGTSVDRDGVEFATLVQTQPELGLYWYLSQFHPEKTQYIFDATGDENLQHSLSAVFANQYLAEFFVNECRLRNEHAMDSDTYWAQVIYNYAPYFIAKLQQGQSQSYEQVYIFD